MKQQSELEELIAAGIISEDTALQIRRYWEAKTAQNPDRLSIVFSILGALLVGLGIILFIAHNWDQLGHLTKTLIAFIPLIGGQIAAWYCLHKRPESRAWREGSGLFLLFAVGACLAMVSQIYHIDGRLSEYLLSWIWLALPIMYVLDSALASLFFWVGISWYATEVSYFEYPGEPAYWYLLFVLAAFPFYFNLRRRLPHSNYQKFHDWLIPLSLVTCLGTLTDDANNYMWLAYQVLLVVCYAIGKWLLPHRGRLISNGWLLVGLLGTVGLLLIHSFRDFWKHASDDWTFDHWQSTEFVAFAFLWAALLGIMVYAYKRKEDLLLNPLCYLGLGAFLYYWLGWSNHFTGAVLANLILLAIGLYHINLGTKKDHLGILNFGLLILTAQILCRFFDTDMSFAIRGLLFLSLGVGFFAANSYLIRRRKNQSS